MKYFNATGAVATILFSFLSNEAFAECSNGRGCSVNRGQRSSSPAPQPQTSSQASLPINFFVVDDTDPIGISGASFSKMTDSEKAELLGKLDDETPIGNDKGVWTLPGTNPSDPAGVLRLGALKDPENWRRLAPDQVKSLNEGIAQAGAASKASGNKNAKLDDTLEKAKLASEIAKKSRGEQVAGVGPVPPGGGAQPPGGQPPGGGGQQQPPPQQQQTQQQQPEQQQNAQNGAGQGQQVGFASAGGAGTPSAAGGGTGSTPGASGGSSNNGKSGSGLAAIIPVYGGKPIEPFLGVTLPEGSSSASSASSKSAPTEIAVAPTPQLRLISLKQKRSVSSAAQAENFAAQAATQTAVKGGAPKGFNYVAGDQRAIGSFRGARATSRLARTSSRRVASDDSSLLRRRGATRITGSAAGIVDVAPAGSSHGRTSGGGL